MDERTKKFLVLSAAIIFALVFVAQPVFAIPAFYQRFESGATSTIGEFIFDDNYNATTTPPCTITIRNPSGGSYITNAAMSTSSDGWYSYTFTASSTQGLYRALMTCVSGNTTSSMDKTFEVGPSFYASTTIAEAIWGYTGSVLDTANNAIAKVWTYVTRSLTTRQIGVNEYIAGVSSSAVVGQVANADDQATVKYNVELVRQATFDFAGFADAGSSSSTLIDSELNQPDNYWQDYNLIMMSVNNIGQSRSVSYSSSTGRVVVSSQFPSDIVAGDKYVLQHETRLIARIWNATTRTLSDFGTLANNIWSNATRSLTTRQIATNEYIAGVATSTTVAQLASQYTIYFSDVGEMQATKTYRAKLTILDYQSTPVNVTSTPTITIYDSLRNTMVSNISMTNIATGTYEYDDYTVPSSPLGVWETTVSVNLGGANSVQLNDYWELEGAPAQVLINSISDNTVPSIAANATITNEGSTAFEYQYEYCIVSSQSNQCGGGDDEASASAAKLIQAGESWNPTLNLTLNAIGTYWFKLVVYWGTEVSGASLQFTAQAEAAPPPSGGGGGGGGGGFVPAPAAVLTLQGKAYPSAKINILKDGQIISTATADVQANFKAQFNNLTAGNYLFGISAEDSEKRKSITLNLPVQLFAGQATTITNILLPPTISLSKDSLSRGETLNINGQAAPESQVEIYIDPKGLIRRAKADTNGKWSYAFDTNALEQGPYMVKSKATSPEGWVSSFSQFMKLGIGIQLPTTCAGADLNRDGKVNLVDFSILMYSWGKKAPTNNACVDINADGKINIADFSIMLYWWTG